MPCEKASVCLAAWQIHSSCSQKVFILVRSHSQKLANWILTKESLQKPDVILQDREVPSASGRILEHLIIQIVKWFHCSTLLLLYTANVATSVLLSCSLPWGSQQKQMKWAKNDCGHRTPSGVGKAEADWLLCNTWLQIQSWSFATFLPR